MSSQTISVLMKLKTSLERAGAKIPCENRGSIESAVQNGLSIALLLVTDELAALKASAPAAAEPVAMGVPMGFAATVVQEISYFPAATSLGPVAEPVGEAGSMPGTSGFTMACFKAADVPIGTKLYTRPPAIPDGYKLVPAHDPLFSTRRDAARYRLLRTLVGAEMTRHGISAYLPCGISGLKPDQTDAAIDAALSQGAKQ